LEYIWRALKFKEQLLQETGKEREMKKTLLVEAQVKFNQKAGNDRQDINVGLQKTSIKLQVANIR